MTRGSTKPGVLTKAVEQEADDAKQYLKEIRAAANEEVDNLVLLHFERHLQRTLLKEYQAGESNKRRRYEQRGCALCMRMSR